MSRENVIKFYEEVRKNEKLNKEFEILKNQIENGKETNEKNLAGKIVSIAKKNGFDFTEKDLLNYMEEIKNSLSEEELLNVSGGRVSAKAAGIGLLGTLMLSFGAGAVFNLVGQQIGSTPTQQQQEAILDNDNDNDNEQEMQETPEAPEGNLPSGKMMSGMNLGKRGMPSGRSITKQSKLGRNLVASEGETPVLEEDEEENEQLEDNQPADAQPADNQPAEAILTAARPETKENQEYVGLKEFFEDVDNLEATQQNQQSTQAPAAGAPRSAEGPRSGAPALATTNNNLQSTMLASDLKELMKAMKNDDKIEITSESIEGYFKDNDKMKNLLNNNIQRSMELGRELLKKAKEKNLKLTITKNGVRVENKEGKALTIDEIKQNLPLNGREILGLNYEQQNSQTTPAPTSEGYSDEEIEEEDIDDITYDAAIEQNNIDSESDGENLEQVLNNMYESANESSNNVEVKSVKTTNWFARVRNYYELKVEVSTGQDEIAVTQDLIKEIAEKQGLGNSSVIGKIEIIKKDGTKVNVKLDNSLDNEVYRVDDNTVTINNELAKVKASYNAARAQKNEADKEFNKLKEKKETLEKQQTIKNYNTYCDAIKDVRNNTWGTEWDLYVIMKEDTDVKAPKGNDKNWNTFLLAVQSKLKTPGFSFDKLRSVQLEKVRIRKNVYKKLAEYEENDTKPNPQDETIEKYKKCISEYNKAEKTKKEANNAFDSADLALNNIRKDKRQKRDEKRRDDLEQRKIDKKKK